MASPHFRSFWNGQSAIPRLGFLLFILALAIVGWPKLRLAHEAVEPRIPDLEGAPRLSSADVRLSTRVTAEEIPEGFDSEKNHELTNTTSMHEKGLAMDGQTKDLLSLVTDNSLRMAKREMPAYWELVRKTANSSFNQLREEANSSTKFNDFFSDPAKHRGELVSLDIIVRRVTRFDAEVGNSAGVNSVYEIWGSTDESHAWLYVFITNALPKGFDEETLLRKKTEFAGYFLKLLAYHPGSAPPNAKPLLAPLLVGRFNDVQQTTQTSKSNTSEWASWGMTAIVVVTAVFFTVRVFLNAEQKKRRRRDHGNGLKNVDPTWFESDQV